MSNDLDESSQPLPFDDGFCPDRRAFLATLAAAGLLLGSPSFAVAGSSGSALQTQVNDLIKRMRRQGLIGSRELTSWSVYDLTSEASLVSINETVPRQAASMIKPLVAQAYFYQVARSPGRVRYTDEIRRSMERMIQRSSNPSTNLIMDKVSQYRHQRGPADVEGELKEQAPSLFQQVRIVERIPADGCTYRNLASAQDYRRFLIALWNGRTPYHQELRRLMALPNNDRLTHGIAAIPESVRVYDKTGSTARLCGNMGIIEARDRWGERHAYIIVGIIQRTTSAKDYGSWIRGRGNVIRKVSNLVYLEMKDRHKLI